MDHLICVCISRLHHCHRDAGIITVLTDVLSYSSGALDNLVDHMYPQGVKPLWEIVPPGTQPVEHISTLVQNSNREVDLVEPTDVQWCQDMCAENGLSFEGVMSQFTQLQKYTDFLDPSRTPPHHLFRPPPAIQVHALTKDIHDYDKWKKDLCHAIMLDCNEWWSWDFMRVPMVPECLFWPTERPPCPDSGFWFRGISTWSPTRSLTQGLSLILGTSPSAQQCHMMCCGLIWHSESYW